MRTAFIVCFLANLALTVVALLVCPSNVAIHFGPGGEPNGWATSHVSTVISIGLNVLVFASIFFTPHLVRASSSRWISLPNKAYWLKEENRNRMEARLAAHMYEFGLLLFVFLFVVHVLTLQANLSSPVRLREDIFLWSFGLFMAYTVYWTVRILLAFRVPKEGH